MYITYFCNNYYNCNWRIHIWSDKADFDVLAW